MLRLIRRYLHAGLVAGGIAMARNKGTPQGGPQSALLSNVLFDDLDKERATRSCLLPPRRDCNIYVRTQRAAEQVMASITRFLTERLRLQFDATKSAVDVPGCHRVGDPRMISLSRRWVKGVVRGGRPSEEGTPQAGSISVLLGNLYLLYVLDLSFERVAKSRFRGSPGWCAVSKTL
ncbi:hypothetical protein ACE10Z_34675 [Bradyrhizobium sp. Pha-3]|uniref:hypothetical protein n=1 Tax=Bradyrhizobium sp. Pha-3 TaxID=208375 RepID=UPI0035D46E71